MTFILHSVFSLPRSYLCAGRWAFALTGASVLFLASFPHPPAEWTCWWSVKQNWVLFVSWLVQFAVLKDLNDIAFKIIWLTYPFHFLLVVLTINNSTPHLQSKYSILFSCHSASLHMLYFFPPLGVESFGSIWIKTVELLSLPREQRLPLHCLAIGAGSSFCAYHSLPVRVCLWSNVLDETASQWQFAIYS